MNKFKRFVSCALACAVTAGSYLYLAGTGKVENASITVGAAETYVSQCKEMLDLINKYRAENGVEPLKLYIPACNAAMTRSSELVSAFSHDRPNGSSCFTVLDDYSIIWSSAGENIAYGYPSVQSVMNGWMNSEGHRANILSSDFDYMGIGINSSSDGIYWTQLFIGLIEGEQGGIGDVNCDYEINAVDASAVLQYYAYQATSPFFEQSETFKNSADVNGDGSIDAIDASAILKYYAQKSTGETPSWS